MAKMLIVKTQRFDANAGWINEPGFRLITSETKPTLAVGAYDNYQKAVAAAAGSELVTITSSSQLTKLWLPRVEAQDVAAQDKKNMRREEAVRKYVNYAVNPTGLHYLRKMILCDESGELPPHLQPPCPVLVFREGGDVAIDAVSSEEIAAGIASLRNEQENKVADQMADRERPADVNSPKKSPRRR